MNPDFQRSPPRLARFFKAPLVYLVAFIACLISAGTTTVFYFSTKSGRKSTSYFGTFFTILIVLALALFIAMYTRGYLRIRQVVAENPVYANRDEPNTSERPEYLNRLFKTVLLILVAMFSSWVPSVILNILLTITYTRGDDNMSSSYAFIAFREIAIALYYSNSFVNALIIFYRNEKSKKWLAQLCCSCRKDRNIDVMTRNATVNSVVAQ